MSCSAVLPRILTSREETPLCQLLQGAVLAPKTLSRAMAQARSLAGRRRASPLPEASPLAPRPDTLSQTRCLVVTVKSVHRLATDQVPRGARAPRATSALIAMTALRVPRVTTVLVVPSALRAEIATTVHPLATARVPHGARAPIALTAMIVRLEEIEKSVQRGATVSTEAIARLEEIAATVPSARPMVRRTTSVRTAPTATRTTTMLRASSATTASSASAKTNARVATQSSTPQRVTRGLRPRMSFLSAFRRWPRPRPMLMA